MDTGYTIYSEDRYIVITVGEKELVLDIDEGEVFLSDFQATLEFLKERFRG